MPTPSPATRNRAAHLLVALAVSTGFAAAAAAETDKMRIIAQPSLSSLPFMVMQNEDLIEKHLAAAGVDGVDIEWLTVAGGNVSSDIMISGQAEFAAAGLAAFLPLMARTMEREDYAIRGVASYNTIDLALVSRNPDVETIDDFTESDRIALPAVGASIQAIALQMEAAKRHGIENYAMLDHLTVSRGHPDAVAAFMSSGEITAHFSSPPYQEDELKLPGAHKVTSIQEIVGGPVTSGLVYTRVNYREENPKSYRAFYDALMEALELIEADPRTAAEAYIAVSGERREVEDVMALLETPALTSGSKPQGTMAIANFMNEIGTIDLEITGWQDLFFPEIHEAGGS
jgi:NitT/TauT family transport system substrate-binding protein